MYNVLKSFCFLSSISAEASSPVAKALRAFLLAINTFLGNGRRFVAFSTRPAENNRFINTVY